MKKQVKKNLIAALSLAFVASFGVAGLVKSNVNAGAVDVPVEGNFQMDDGAAIRIKSNTPSGIRWSVTVTESYYNYVTSLGEVEWGMVVDNEPITEMGASDTQVNIPLVNQALPAFDANDDVEETWTYYASITYDKLVADMEEAGYTDDQIETKLTQAYETVLYARAYNVVNGTTELAVDADTGRSIKNVAMNCLIQESTQAGNPDVTDANKSTFETYAGGDYAVAATKEFNNESAYATYAKTGVVTAEVTDGTYAAYFGAKYVGDVTATDGKVTVNPTGLAESQLTLGELSNINLVSGSEVTQVPFIAATHIIGDQAAGVSDVNEWNAEMKYTSSGSSDKNDTITADWYVVAIKDMDFGGVSTVSKSRYYHKFAGKFNGLGHTLSNYSIMSNQQGLFGALTRPDGSAHGAWIHNVAFTNVTVGHTGGYAVAEQMWGTGHELKNVYVQATYTEQGASNGVWMGNGTATVENCIVDLTYTYSPATAYAYSASNHNSNNFTASTVYAATNATTTAFEGGSGDNTAETPSSAVASSMSALFPTIAADIQDGFGDTNYWGCDGYGIQFGGKTVWQNKTTLETAYLDEDTTISLSELTGGSVEKVLLNGREIPSDYYENDNLTCVVSDYTLGELNTISVYGNNKIVEQPFVACTYAIGTPEELQYFFQYNKGSQNANTTQTAGWYVVLTDDIDMEGATVTAVNHTTGPSDYPWGGMWQGTFNGLGHVVANLKTNGQGGVFGTFAGGTVENVAFVGVEHCGDSYMFTNYGRNTMGYIKNVYIEGITTHEKDGTSVIRGNNITVSNLIVNVNKVNLSDTNKAYAFGTELAGNHGSNLYVIGNLTRISEKDGRNFNTQLYSTVAAWATGNATNINATNGWNMDCWKFIDGDLYFGVKKVEDVTYTSVGADTVVLP